MAGEVSELAILHRNIQDEKVDEADGLASVAATSAGVADGVVHDENFSLRRERRESTRGLISESDSAQVGLCYTSRLLPSIAILVDADEASEVCEVEGLELIDDGAERVGHVGEVTSDTAAIGTILGSCLSVEAEVHSVATGTGRASGTPRVTCCLSVTSDDYRLWSCGVLCLGSNDEREGE